MMQIFAEMLRGMTSLDPDILEQLENDDIDVTQSGEEGDGASYASFTSDEEGETSTPGAPSPALGPPSHSRSRPDSLRFFSAAETNSDMSSSTPSLHTTPLTFTSARAPSGLGLNAVTSTTSTPRTPSANSFTHRSQPHLLPSQIARSPKRSPFLSPRSPSSHSLRPLQLTSRPPLQTFHSAQSNNSLSLRQIQSNTSRASSRSVIRLAEAADGPLDLPYVIDSNGRQ